MSSYLFRQGIDYGPRKGTLGLAFHMSEGNDGLVNYLARAAGETLAQWRTRVRGVSANVCILSDGTKWQMVDWANASGSMNPADRNLATTGYYNGTVIRAVLGPNYVDPNAWSLSCELAGRRADGPTDAQVRSAIEWGKDMAALEPTIRGAYGHNDQTDTKGCPGTTPNMRAIFEGLGGHGLWVAGGTDEMTITITTLPFGGRYLIKAGTAPTGIKLDAAGAVIGTKKWVATATDAKASYDATVTSTGIRGNPFIRCTDGFFAGYLVPASAVVETPNPAPALDCTAAVKAAVETALNHVVPAADAVDRAITEARIR